MVLLGASLPSVLALGLPTSAGKIGWVTPVLLMFGMRQRMLQVPFAVCSGAGVSAKAKEGRQAEEGALVGLRSQRCRSRRREER